MDDASLDACFGALKDRWGTLDFVVHAIAYSDKTELAGRFINTSRENFRNSLTISCYSFIDIARRASELMPDGGALLTPTYQGVEPGDALLQRDGRGEIGAGIGGAVSRQ